jgi:signal transduction histidine kinase
MRRLRAAFDARNGARAYRAVLMPKAIPRVDVAIAGAALVWAALEALLADGPGSPAVRLLLAVGFSLPLLVRRSHPIGVLLAIAGCAVARGLLDGPPEVGAMPFPALLLASFSAALYAQPRALAYAAAPVPAVTMPLAGYDGGLDYGPLIFLSLAAWTAGFLVHRRVRQVERERARAPERAREALDAERARLARELHAVVTQSVTGISAQAGAADALLDRDPGRALEHIENVRHGAHDALVELRRLVGVLREDEPTYAPQPGLDRLDELADQARAAGQPVELCVEGARGAVRSGVDLAAYRICQEALADARRRAAGAPTRVIVRYVPGQIELEILDGRGRAAGSDGSEGLIGMAERARLYGGTLDAGPAPRGGFVVRAVLPLAADQRAADPEEPVPEVPLVELARVPRGIPRADVAIASGLLVWGLIEALTAQGSGSQAVRLALAVGCVAPLLVRRRWPLPALAVICVLIAMRAPVLDVQQEGSMPFPALLLATFSAALYARPRALGALALPLAVPALVVAVLADDLSSPGAIDVAVLVALTVGAWAVGWLVRRRADQAARERARGPVLAREAVASERRRIARELHDVIAHSLTGISVQAGAAEAILDRDSDRAHPYLEAVQRAAGEALVELRRLVGVLREEDDELGEQPGLSRLDDLVAQSRAAGLPVELRLEGARGWLSAGIDLAAYRICQEALTNVRRHAGAAPTLVRIEYASDHVGVEVTNDPGTRDGAIGPGTGHGLIGMHERVRLYNGTLEADPLPGGGFAVRAKLPRE